MPFHTFAYTALDGVATINQDIPAITDNFLTVQNNHFISQTDMDVIALYAQDPGITNARLNTPHYRAVSIPSLQFLAATSVPASPPAIDWFPPSKLKIPAIDEIAFEISNNGAGGIRACGVVWAALPGHNFNLPMGDIYTIRGTGTITATLNVWTAGSFTLDQTLPQGNYAVVGLSCFGTNLTAARLVFQGVGPRPGVLGRTVLGNFGWPNQFQRGNLGVWGTFPNTAQPNLEILAFAANTAQTVFIDVIRIGANPFAP